MDDPTDTYLAIGSVLFVAVIGLTVFARIVIDNMRIENILYHELD